MPLYKSTEARWFFPQEAVNLAAWQGWFKIAASHRQSPRTDAYLMQPQTAAVGIKQREGRLEVKSLVTAPAPFALQPLSFRVTGTHDSWIKWSFKSPNDAALAASLATQGPWFAVHKKRALHLLVLEAGDAHLLEEHQHVAQGCIAELTELHTAQGDWLTLGFEAFGEDLAEGKNPARLLGYVQGFLERLGAPPEALDTPRSQSYPLWLQQLNRS